MQPFIDPTEDLAFAGVARLGELLRAAVVTPRELVELYVARIQRLDPHLNAFVSVRAEAALAEADEARERLRAGESGPLLGVPVVVKDNVDIAREVTGHGTDANDAPADRDAEVVRRLRAAGAPILGKTTLAELELWGHMTESPTRVTRNPWDIGRSVGGSSGGTAAAVAAGLAPVGLGSDGGASIRVPAALCGLVGLKPTRGRISTLPEPERWYGLTVFGGLARSVLDLALFDDALRGPAAGDAHTPPEPALSFAEAAVMALRPRLRVAVSLKGTIPGIKPGLAARRAVEDTADLLRSRGHVVAESDPRYGLLLPDLTPPYLAGVADGEARLDYPERLERRSRHMAAIGRRLDGRALQRALRRQPAVARRINALFADHDVLLTPVTAAQPPPVETWRGSNALRTFHGSGPYVTYTAVWNYLGQPAAAVPAGFDQDGLPVAVQLVAPANGETTLLSLAAELEQARPWAHRRPVMV